MWVQEQALGETLTRDELEALVRTSDDLVVATLPKSRRPGGSRRHERGAGAVENSESFGRYSKKPDQVLPDRAFCFLQ